MESRIEMATEANGKNMESEKKKSMAGPVIFDQKTLHDAIYLRNPFTNVRAAKKTRYLVFLISGNPGLIEYYRSFLNIMYGGLTRTEAGAEDDVVFEVYGRSMGGFELGAALDDGETKSSSSKLPTWLRRNKYYDLQQQIEFVEERLCECVEQLARGANGRAPKVVLVGHSVGSYVLLELVRRHRERLEHKRRRKGVKWQDETPEVEVVRPAKSTPTISRQRAKAKKSIRTEPDIVGGICLFPTVVNIGLSKRGRVLAALSRVPLFSSAVSSLAKVLTTTLPRPLLYKLTGSITGMSGHNLDVTVAFLKSRRGVHQALHMGCDEMQRITTDKWDAEVWGAVHPSPTRIARPRLFFYFGEADDWVANHTRDDLMRLRGRGEDGDDWRPWMEIDKMETPHGFSIEHSGPVAEKVVEYVRTIVGLSQDVAVRTSKSEFSLAKNRLSSATLGSNRTSTISL